MNLKQKFQQGLSYAEYLKRAGIYLPQYKSSYQRADVVDEERDFFSQVGKLNILVLAEPWCGDVTAILPAVAKAVEGLDNIDLRVLLRNQNLELMELYLTNGKSSLPKFIFLDEDFKEIANWGSRPQEAQDIFFASQWKDKLGMVGKMVVFNKIRKFYRQDRGRAVLKEIRELLNQKLH